MKSMYLALVSVIVAVLALLNSCSVHVNDGSLMMSFLGVLVTLLVALNIVQYMFAEERVRRIAREEARPTFNTIEDDLMLMYKGMTFERSVSWFVSNTWAAKDIDSLFKALAIYQKVHNTRLSTPAISEVHSSLLSLIRASEQNGGVLVYEGKSEEYKTLLKNGQGRLFPRRKVKRLLKLLDGANEISEKEVRKVRGENS